MDPIPENQEYDPNGDVIHGPWAMPDQVQDLDSVTEEVPQSPDVRRMVARRMFKRAFAEPGLTMDDLATQRTVICWRILRRWASILGHPAGDLSVRSLFTAQRPDAPLEAQELPAEASWQLPSDVLKAHDEWRSRPLPLCPLSLEGSEAAQYCRMLDAVANLLKIPAGALENKDLGRYGLRFLGDPEFVVQAHPGAFAVVRWEQHLVDTVMEMLPKRGSWGVIKWMRAKFAFGDSEAKLILDLALEQARGMTNATLEQRRAIMQLRLERIYDRSEDSDPRVALAASKTLAQVQGLTREIGEGDEFDDVLAALQDAVSERQEDSLRELGFSHDD